MAGAIRRRAVAMREKVKTRAKAVGAWTKRVAQVAVGARLSKRAMKKAPAPGRLPTSEGGIRRLTQGNMTRIFGANEIEVSRRRGTVRYNAQGLRVQSSHVTRGNRVATDKAFRPGAFRPVEVKKRYQKR